MVVSESQFLIPHVTQHRCPQLVSLFLLCCKMIFSIDLDDSFPLDTDEINNEVTYDMLSAEL